MCSKQCSFVGQDKWRNMNIGDGGYLSRERSLRSPAKHKAPKRASEPISPLPLAMIPHEYTAEEVRGSSDSPKSLEARYNLSFLL